MKAAAKRAPVKAGSKITIKRAGKVIAADPIVARYEELLATVPSLERKGDANPYTSVNGNMFTLLHQSRDLAIRLPEGAREEFIKKHKTKLFEAYGAVMKEYVAVPASLLSNTRQMEKYLQLSYDYAKMLKPKATKKKSA